MHDVKNSRLVAVKQMPNDWVGNSHEEFVSQHPCETEHPWQDIGTTNFLGEVGYPYSCDLLGVFRDEEHTEVVTAFATNGDLYSWCQELHYPVGLEREMAIWPIAVQVLRATQQLHDLCIAHRDISMENVLLSESEGGAHVAKIIDFGMASTARHIRHSRPGKPMYQAPELQTDLVCDAFLCDTFSLGVTLFSIAVQDYPWASTKPGICKCFAYFRKRGLRALLQKRRVRESSQRLIDVMSDSLVQLLEGLLCICPEERLTLGEQGWPQDRASVWTQPWVQEPRGAF